MDNAKLVSILEHAAAVGVEAALDDLKTHASDIDPVYGSVIAAVISALIAGLEKALPKPLPPTA